MFGGWNANGIATCLLAWQPITMPNLRADATSGPTLPLAGLLVIDPRRSYQFSKGAVSFVPLPLLLPSFMASGEKTVQEDLWFSNPAVTRLSAPSSGFSTQT